MKQASHALFSFRWLFYSRFVHSQMILLTIVYLRMTTYSLQAVVCTNLAQQSLDGSIVHKSVLTVDGSTECYKGKHLAAAFFIWPVLIFYCIGFPVVSVLLLVRVFKITHIPSKLLRLGGVKKPSSNSSDAVVPAQTQRSDMQVNKSTGADVTDTEKADAQSKEARLIARILDQYRLDMYGFIWRSMHRPYVTFRCARLLISAIYAIAVVLISDVELQFFVFGLTYLLFATVTGVTLPYSHGWANAGNFAVPFISVIQMIISLRAIVNGNQYEANSGESIKSTLLTFNVNVNQAQRFEYTLVALMLACIVAVTVKAGLTYGPTWVRMFKAFAVRVTHFRQQRASVIEAKRAADLLKAKEALKAANRSLQTRSLSREGTVRSLFAFYRTHQLNAKCPNHPATEASTPLRSKNRCHLTTDSSRSSIPWRLLSSLIHTSCSPRPTPTCHTIVSSRQQRVSPSSPTPRRRRTSCLLNPSRLRHRPTLVH